MAFPWWIENDGVFEFEVLVILRGATKSFKIIKNKNNYGPSLLPCYSGNGKNPSVTTTIIDRLLLIV